MRGKERANSGYKKADSFLTFTLFQLRLSHCIHYAKISYIITHNIKQIPGETVLLHHSLFFWVVFYNAVFYVTFMFDIKSNISKVNKKKKPKTKTKTKCISMKLRSRLNKFFGWVMTCKQIVNCRLNIPKHVLSINFIVVNIFVLRDVY